MLVSYNVSPMTMCHLHNLNNKDYIYRNLQNLNCTNLLTDGLYTCMNLPKQHCCFGRFMKIGFLCGLPFIKEKKSQPVGSNGRPTVYGNKQTP